MLAATDIPRRPQRKAARSALIDVHARFTEAVRQESGITQGLLRLSVGLENTDDLIKDLEFALDQV